ncbi:MAG: hypothetical protein H8E42_08055 [Nitrospinae bacterium]|nr:hypothetical protein [Nitrospinota bacterium]MBL7019202.1 hypothetical protein [Nitrospinaceae bacterium]
MQSSSKIHHFLNRLQAKWNRVLLIQAAYSVLTVIAGCALATGLFFYFQSPLLSYGWSSLIIILLGWCLHSYSGFSRIDREQAALLTEAKYPELNNSLINAIQLERHLTKPQGGIFSLSFIREQLQRTESEIQKLDPDSVVSGQRFVPARNVFLVTLLALITATTLLPDFKVSSDSQEMAIQKENKEDLQPVENQTAYQIDNLSLTLEFPAYTRLKRQIITQGSFKALPGTEVQISGNSNLPVERAELVVNNRDHFVMTVNDFKNLNGSFMLREKGHYQFRVKPPDEEKVLLKEKYSIELDQDKSPQVILFPANPKPVYYETDRVQIFYEAHDDFGIRKIDLIAQVNDTTLTKSVKSFKHSEKDSTGSYTWNLSLEKLQPGDEVQYFLEIKDNDNVTGPNTGQSEIYSFIVFDSRKEQENLVRLQEELSEKMIALLANGLVEGEILKTSTTDPLYGKKILASHADALIDIIGLAQRIKDQAKDFDNFPRPYLTLLTSIITGLTAIREDQIDTLNKIQGTIMKPTPVSFNLGSVEILNARMVTHLEQDILYLIKMTNRQKMDQVMDLEDQLSQLTEALREEFENIRDKKSPLTSKQVNSKLNEIQQTLQKMMDKLSRQNQSAPDEFLNSKAYKSMNLEETLASLEKIKDLANQGKIDEALEQLKKVAEDLRELANQLDQSNSSMDSLVDNQVMEQINESVAKLESLEKKQKEIIEKTSEINQKLRAKQARQFEFLIKNFFDELKKDVTAIQNLLEENSKYLDEHKAMTKMRELMQEETRIRQKIKSLSQKTIDSSLSEDLGDNFKALNEARKQLSTTVIEQDNLRTRGFQNFKENLPQIKKRYETLRELTELNELNEFNALFKNTYPEIFRWQGSMRSTRNQREDIGDRLNQDLREVTRLNAEISKKLGSLKRSIERDSQSLLTDKEKTQLDQLSRQEQEMSQQAEAMKDSFIKMNQENPLVPPTLSRNMGDAQRNLKNAQDRLQTQQVQRGIDSENRAMKSLQDTRKQLNEIKNSGTQMSNQGKRETPLRLGTGSRRDSRRGGSVRMQKEKVLLPSEDQYKVPSAFREDILDAMKKQTPKDYERLVNEYYKELVQ